VQPEREVKKNARQYL